MSTNAGPPPEPLLDGRYRLGACVGEGGMARVYRALDVSLGRTVAVKLLRPGLDGVAAPERARSEMTVLASLNHPSLVTLFDARLVPGQPEYLVMEFVDGPTLSERIARGPLPPGDVAALAGELAEALHVAHSSGVVHRDVKPSNVLFAPAQLPGGRPRAKLADFGIALLLDSARVTSPGTIIGTAAYLAPEQVRGAAPAGPADIYALGLVLLEALSGRRAYPQGDAMGAALARLHAPPEIPASLGAEWVDLLRGMTSEYPARRPHAADVAAAASALVARAQAGFAPTAPPAPGALPPVPARNDVDAAAGDAPGAPATGPTRAYTQAETRVLPPPAAPPGGARSVDSASPPRRRRPPRGVFIAAAAALAVAVAVAIWGADRLGAGTPEPAPSDSAVTEPSAPATPAPAATQPAAPPPAGEDADVTGDEREAAEEAREEAEDAAEEARKAAEKAAREAAKKAERENGKSGD